MANFEDLEKGYMFTRKIKDMNKRKYVNKANDRAKGYFGIWLIILLIVGIVKAVQWIYERFIV